MAIPQEIRSIWTDAYSFYAQFRGVRSQQEWQQCADTMVKISNAHGDHPLARQILLCVYNQLEREAANG